MVKTVCFTKKSPYNAENVREQFNGLRRKKWLLFVNISRILKGIHGNRTELTL
jgi:hypothetical protein